MKIIKVETGALCANTYIVSGDNKRAVLIDCGDDPLKIENALITNGLECAAVLLTHGHFDHCNGAAYFSKKGVPVYLHENDIELIDGDGNLAYTFGLKFNDFSVDIPLKGGEGFSLCGLDINVMHTPGHTAGGVCFIVNDEVIFSGDTLFYLSVGRTDFPSGDEETLRASLKNKLFTLEKDFKIYPGHDRATSLFFERDNNFNV